MVNVLFQHHGFSMHAAPDKQESDPGCENRNADQIDVCGLSDRLSSHSTSSHVLIVEQGVVGELQLTTVDSVKIS